MGGRLQAQILALVGLAALVMALVAAAPASAATLKVCATGCEYTTIGAALAAATDGDRIVIGAGTYVERVTISDDVSVMGAGSSKTIIQGPDVGSELNVDPVVGVEAGASASISGVTITGGHVEGSGGGIVNAGTLDLSRTAVVGNDAIFDGGSILNLGTLTISQSTIAGIAGHESGGGINNSGSYSSRTAP